MHAGSKIRYRRAIADVGAVEKRVRASILLMRLKSFAIAASSSKKLAEKHGEQ